MSFPQPGGQPLPISLERMLLLLIAIVGGTKLLAPMLLLPFAPLENVGPSAMLALTAFTVVVQAAITLVALQLLILKPYRLNLLDLGLLSLPKGWFSRAIVAGALCVFLAGLVNLGVQSLLGGPLENPQLMAVAPMGFSWTALVVMLVLTGVVAPFVEELAFRGLLYRWLRERMDVRKAMLVSAFLFAVLHGIPVLIPALMAVGYIFAWVYEQSRSLWAPVIAHAIFNMIMTAALYGALASDIQL